VKSKVKSPSRLSQPDPEAQELRCADRDYCLGVAAGLDWPGLSCRECQAYRPQSPAEYRRDMEGLAKLHQILNELGPWMPDEHICQIGPGRWRRRPA
jgi:hypothetical protein